MKPIPSSLVLFAAACSPAAFGQPAVPPATPPNQPSAPLGSAVFNWGDLKAIPTAVGARRGVFGGPTVTLDEFRCHVTTLRAGVASHAAHRHPDEEMLIVKEGTIEVSIDGKTQRASAGSIVVFASNVEHGLRNPGPEEATYYVFRWITPKTAEAAAAAATKAPESTSAAVATPGAAEAAKK